MTKTWLKFLWGPYKGRIKHASKEEAARLVEQGMAEKVNPDGSPVEKPKPAYQPKRRTYRGK